MKKLIIPLCLCTSSALASPTYIGTWFSCDIKSGEYSVLEVEKQKNQYTGLLESSRNGGVYSAQLSGIPRKSSITLRGCQSYRGETCNNTNPQIVVTLKSSSNVGFTRISKASLNQYVKQCSENSNHGVSQ